MSRSHYFLVTAVFLASCGFNENSSVELLDEANYSISISSPPSTNAQPNQLQEGIVIYLISDTGLRTHSLIVSSPITAETVTAALNGPFDENVTARGLRTGFYESSDLITDISTAGSVATIDLSESFTELPGDEQLLILGQIVLSIIANTEITSINFTSNNIAIKIPNANGKLIRGAAQRADFVDLVTR
jgi:spore germination protein GerM